MALDRIAALLELSEAEALWGYETNAPADVAERLGLASMRIGGGVVLSVRHDATDYWSKALGFNKPVTAELVASITDFYREHGCRQATLQFAPAVLPAGWDEIRAKEGITEGSTWLKLARLSGLVESPESELRVAKVEASDADEWATVLTRGFGMPVDQVVPMVKGVVGLPGWTAYGAWDGDQMVAAASLLITGGGRRVPGSGNVAGVSRSGRAVRPAGSASEAGRRGKREVAERRDRQAD